MIFESMKSIPIHFQYSYLGTYLKNQILFNYLHSFDYIVNQLSSNGGFFFCYLYLKKLFLCISFSALLFFRLFVTCNWLLQDIKYLACDS